MAAAQIVVQRGTVAVGHTVQASGGIGLRRSLWRKNPTAKRVAQPWECQRALQIERTSQIAKIGNNLNQIARWANTYKSTADAVEVVTHLVAIEQALLALNSSGGDRQ